ncbi:MAG: nucleosidase [Alphaproteobacteria bacterium]|nr:nucleosidase [Alphaproteobacteria bacterium]
MNDCLLVFAVADECGVAFGDYTVLNTGVGKLNAAYALMKALGERRPSLVVNLGTAGSAVHPAGTVVHCTSFVQRDMDVSPLGFERGVTPFSNEGVRLEYGLEAPGLPHAVCGTGDSFETAHTGEEYCIVDMEAYALAVICKRENIPFLCLKYISDGADGRASQDWCEALEKASVALRGALDAWLADR